MQVTCQGNKYNKNMHLDLFLQILEVRMKRKMTFYSYGQLFDVKRKQSQD